MKIGILACSVFEPELEKVLSDIENKKLFEDNIKVTYLHFGLHTNLDKLEKDVTDSLDKLTLSMDPFLFFGLKLLISGLITETNLCNSNIIPQQYYFQNLFKYLFV